MTSGGMTVSDCVGAVDAEEEEGSAELDGLEKGHIEGIIVKALYDVGCDREVRRRVCRCAALVDQLAFYGMLRG